MTKKLPSTFGERHEHERVGVGIDACLVNFFIAGAEAFDGNFTAAKGFDHTLAADGFFHDTVDLAQFLLQVAETFAGVSRDELRKPEHDRYDDQRGDRQPYD